jgi:hypothetical protein
VLVEIAKPVALVSCILSLYAVFHTAFLVPSIDLQQRICDAIALLALAAGISLIGGVIFSAATQAPRTGSPRLTATLPVRLFCWASGGMLVLFILAWYLETYVVFYRDVHF